MMIHMQKEFISSEHVSPEELREFKSELSIKIKQFESEIQRARWTFDHMKLSQQNGILVPVSDVNYAEMEERDQKFASKLRSTVAGVGK